MKKAAADATFLGPQHAKLFGLIGQLMDEQDSRIEELEAQLAELKAGNSSG